MNETKYARFAPSDNNDANYRPKLEVTYVEDTTPPMVTIISQVNI